MIWDGGTWTVSLANCWCNNPNRPPSRNAVVLVSPWYVLGYYRAKYDPRPINVNISVDTNAVALPAIYYRINILQHIRNNIINHSQSSYLISLIYHYHPSTEWSDHLRILNWYQNLSYWRPIICSTNSLYYQMINPLVSRYRNHQSLVILYCYQPGIY
jgi:hypothetical protein